MTRAIWRSLILELAETGYGALSVERVARRAKVGKAALYRRWPSKQAMVLDMIQAIEIPVVSADDCGSLPADLMDYLRKAAHFVRRPLARRLLPEFYAEISRGGPLGEALRSKIQGAKTTRLIELLERARRRGEIGHLPEPALVSALIIGPIYWAWMIERSAVGEETIQKLALALTVALIALAKHDTAP